MMEALFLSKLHVIKGKEKIDYKGREGAGACGTWTCYTLR